jgi:hypothetical protein
MTEELQALALFGLTFITLIFFIATMRKNGDDVEAENEPTTRQKPTPPRKQQTDDILCALNWLLMHNIIDNKQYNELIVKCLPFLE